MQQHHMQISKLPQLYLNYGLNLPKYGSCLYLCKHGYLACLANQGQGTEYIKLDEIKCQF
jgi:hypothetical protein